MITGEPLTEMKSLRIRCIYLAKHKARLRVTNCLINVSYCHHHLQICRLPTDPFLAAEMVTEKKQKGPQTLKPFWEPSHPLECGARPAPPHTLRQFQELASPRWQAGSVGGRGQGGDSRSQGESEWLSDASPQLHPLSPCYAGLGFGLK